MANYLYGASVQGIQDFIFETNKLKEIVGASNLIEQFTSEDFIEDFLRENKGSTKNYTMLRNAGGNIRLSFEAGQKNTVEIFVKYFPKYIMQKAYGITISQAVIEYKDGAYLEANKSLEILLKDARNRVPLTLDAKFALMKQTPRTGKPHYKDVKHWDELSEQEKVEHYDKGSYQKYNNVGQANKDLLLEKMGIPKDERKKFPLKLSKISNTKNKIAVIHADGNNMGLLLQQMARELEDANDSEIQKVFKQFSADIEEATKCAIKDAFDEVQDKYFELSKYDDSMKQVPFRPIVIGGDDVTVICHADVAIDFIQLYMDKFQENTKVKLSGIVSKYSLHEFGDGLSACAGIAYCNEKFPFHYAVSLAEVLCGRAKNISGREASCLLFHNIHGAAFVDYEQYVQNELIIDNGTMATQLDYGPYYIRDESPKPHLSDLQNLYRAMTKESFPLGKLREWLSELHHSSKYAEKHLERVKIIAERSNKDEAKLIDMALKKLGKNKKINLEKEFTTEGLGELGLDRLIELGRTPIHDILQLKSVQGGK